MARLGCQRSLGSGALRRLEKASNPTMCGPDPLFSKYQQSIRNPAWAWLADFVFIITAMHKANHHDGGNMMSWTTPAKGPLLGMLRSLSTFSLLFGYSCYSSNIYSCPFCNWRWQINGKIGDRVHTLPPQLVPLSSSQAHYYSCDRFVCWLIHCFGNTKFENNTSVTYLSTSRFSLL